MAVRDTHVFIEFTEPGDPKLKVTQTFMEILEKVNLTRGPSKIQLKLVRNNISLDDMISIDDESLTGDPIFVRKDLSETVNDIKVQYAKRVFASEESVSSSSASSTVSISISSSSSLSEDRGDDVWD